MAYIDPDRVNDPSSSPGSSNGHGSAPLGNLLDSLGELKSLVPYALAFLSNDGPNSDYAELKHGLRKWAQEDPIDALMAVVLGGGVAFYLAERDTNPGCKTPWDGILYMSTALSVGYDNLFPTTAAGHALATFVQTFGPSLANAAFEPTAAEKRDSEAQANAVNLAILERLDAIVRLLEAKK
jgi:voltage-gated potassium channel